MIIPCLLPSPIVWSGARLVASDAEVRSRLPVWFEPISSTICFVCGTPPLWTWIFRDAVLFGLYNDADDPFVLTQDRFTIAAGRAMTVNACVARMRYVRPVKIPRAAGYVAVRRARRNTYGIVWSIRRLDMDYPDPALD